MSSLGKMMVYGRGGPIEIDAGIAWLEKAAANGHILAQRKLLLIHLGNSKSLFHKLYLRIKLARLAAKAAREMSNDPRWEDWLKSPRA
jgi:TPR repeat protein